ncbi:LuxR C-terminal-related transcriptional regulator [Roseibacterium sp. SDUM158016]|uniref:LuxR C-terminal-related transcriptional regulator n=1 Tax=Roseicyclus sediminis TaxID=2980997 RepID=UPI0021D34AFC|nr:LuxR C-terminal-related transcriptional regulator [Roseibacterium sp. SDUM158016]MCU4652728.1 LuxR C-terminal-related transcriptional regulator [Roseibacterium sp. SDUM158016]
MTGPVKPDELLSPREIEIASAYAQGDTYQAIAERLCIAPSTVRTHLSTIYRKLEVSSKLDLHARLSGASPATEIATDHAAVISELALSLEESLRREQVFAEVLRIISRSRGDIDAVMSAILGFALELCEAEFGILFEHHGGGRFAASHCLGIPQRFRQWFEAQGIFAVGPRTGLGRVAAGHGIVNIYDVRAEEVFHGDDPLRQATATLGGARSFVAIPMMSGDVLAGAFTIYRQSVRPFGAQATALAQTFADQSVIALENARMIGALRDRATSP